MSKINYSAFLLSVILALYIVVLDTKTYETVEMKVEVNERIYELRIYTTNPGKLESLHVRFKNHTLQLFAKHGMVNVGYWIPVDQENTLIYVLSHNSRESAENSWEAFRNDPEWQRVYEESHANGVIVSEVESIFMKAAPYSQIR